MHGYSILTTNTKVIITGGWGWTFFNGSTGFLYRYKELKMTLPSNTLENVHIDKLLKKMEPMGDYISQNPDKMCSKRLLAVLGTLRRWEIDHSDVEFAVNVSYQVQ